MIQGDGFFVLRNGSAQEYSRAGAFTFDSTGTLVNPSGMRVQGWTAAAGVVNNNSAPADIVIPAGTLAPPTESTNATIAGNIAIDPTNTDVLTFGPTVYDAQGKSPTSRSPRYDDGTGATTWPIVDASAARPRPTARSSSTRPGTTTPSSHDPVLGGPRRTARTSSST